MIVIVQGVRMKIRPRSSNLPGRHGPHAMEPVIAPATAGRPAATIGEATNWLSDRPVRCGRGFHLEEPVTAVKPEFRRPTRRECREMIAQAIRQANRSYY